MNTKVVGYLPNDRPSLLKSNVLGFQHVITMFPATVLVAALCGFHVNTVLVMSGVGTIVALLMSKWRLKTYIPLYYGSSFSYIAAYFAIANQMTGALPQFGVPLPDEVLSTIQAGIVVTGLINIAIGLFIRLIGKERLDLFLPPIVTGSVAMLIGYSLARAALDMAKANLLVSFVTLIVTVMLSVFLQKRGFWGMIPILIGAVVGYLLSVVIDPGSINLSSVTEAPLFAFPHFTFPNFTGAMVGSAIISIAIMAIATVPESTAHLYQIGLYVDRLAEELNKPKLHLDRYIGFNLVLDGIDDLLKGLFGGTAGTNYGENNSLMTITRNYSGFVLLIAAVIAIMLGFVGKLAGLVQSVPLAVSGGLAIYLFGTIGMQGVALIQDRKVDLTDTKNLAIGAVILIVGIGGSSFEGGFLPISIFPGVFPNGLPAIATSAVLGILMNLVFVLFAPKHELVDSDLS